MELEARFPGALTSLDKRELSRLRELLQAMFVAGWVVDSDPWRDGH